MMNLFAYIRAGRLKECNYNQEMPLTRLQARKIQKHQWKRLGYTEGIIRQYTPQWKASPIDSLSGHPTLPVTIDGEIVDIDEKLAQIIQRLNDTEFGPITEMSCQADHFGRANISFDYERFGHLMTLIYNRTLIRRDNRLWHFITDECQMRVIPFGDFTSISLTFNPDLCKRFVALWDTVIL